MWYHALVAVWYVCPSGGVCCVLRLGAAQVQDLNEALELLYAGDLQRVVRSTKLNASSTRWEPSAEPRAEPRAAVVL